MEYIIWCVLGMALIVSAQAGRFDRGPQTFYSPLTAAPEIANSYGAKDVLLYLTANQMKALEAGGAFVRPKNNEDKPAYKADDDQEDDDQSVEQEQIKPDQQQIQQSSQNTELEDFIKKIITQAEENAIERQKFYLSQGKSQYEKKSEGNKQKKSDQNQSEEERHFEEKELENTRQIPARFGHSQRQNSEKYLTPSVLIKEKKQVKNTYVRSQHKCRNKVEHQEYLQNKPKFILVDKTPQEETQYADAAQEKLTGLRRPTLSKDHDVLAVAKQKGKLIKNELQLQTYLQEVKEASRYNNQKYAIEIEKLTENLQQQNALARAELLAKSASFLHKEESDISKKPRVSNNLITYKLRAPTLSASQEVERPISVPVLKKSSIEDPVPVEIEKGVPAAAPKPLYSNINEPYYVERVVPGAFNRGYPIRKPGEFTIIRHIWEH